MNAWLVLLTSPLLLHATFVFPPTATLKNLPFRSELYLARADEAWPPPGDLSVSLSERAPDYVAPNLTIPLDWGDVRSASLGVVPTSIASPKFALLITAAFDVLAAPLLAVHQHDEGLDYDTWIVFEGKADDAVRVFVDGKTLVWQKKCCKKFRTTTMLGSPLDASSNRHRKVPGL